jgi:hypothetical protein
MPKAMIAWPDGKLLPADGTSRRIASGSVRPGRSRCTSSLTTAFSTSSFNGTSATSAIASRMRR